MKEILETISAPHIIGMLVITMLLFLYVDRRAVKQVAKTHRKDWNDRFIEHHRNLIK